MAAGTGFHVQTQLDLRKGHITGRVKQLEAGSLYEIRYAKGVAGLRAPEVLYEMSWGKRPGNDESSAGCVMSLLSGDAVFVQTATNPTPTVTVISAGSTFNGLTQNLAPLSEAARKEISATVKAMY